MTHEVAYRLIRAERSGTGWGSGPDCRFWSGYRMAFRKIHSTYRNIVIGDRSIAFEWTASCVNRSGKQLHYDGVSILDTVGPHITYFRTYFDSGRERLSVSTTVH